MTIRKIIPLLLLLAVVLSACRGASEAEEPEATSSPAVTAVLTQPAAAVTQSAPAASGALASCTVVSQPDNSQVEEFFPPVSDDDWVKGPADARVTIIEYSDFQ